MQVLTITGVLTADEVQAVRGFLPALEWRDGRVTAGKTAARVKVNEQANPKTAQATALRDLVMQAVRRHPVLKAAARPRRFSPLLISRTQNGGHYGAHVDNALMKMAGEPPLRTDISFTLFLSEPESYQGGELVVHGAGGTQSLKGDFGDLVLYPTSEIHEVRPVTSGQRIVSVGWIESLIHDAAQRALLFDLENLRASLRTHLDDDAAERLVLDKSIANLLRMWSVP